MNFNDHNDGKKKIIDSVIKSLAKYGCDSNIENDLRLMAENDEKMYRIFCSFFVETFTDKKKEYYESIIRYKNSSQ